MSDSGSEAPLDPVTEDVVRLFHLDLQAGEEQFPAALDLLSPDERRRADRLRNARARRNFVLARAQLRRLLGAYCGLPADEVVLAQGPHGRPEMAQGQGDRILRFSVSHSRDRGAIALTGKWPVGVDIESWRSLDRLDLVAEASFSPLELYLWRVEGKDPRASFFALWTRKEAYLKAVGTGLGTPLQSFATVDPSAVAEGSDFGEAVVRAPGGGGNGFLVLNQPAPPGFSVGLAVGSGSLPVRILAGGPVPDGTRSYR